MNKLITLVLEVEQDDDYTMTDEFIKNDLRTEINCACNRYEIVSMETMILTKGCI